jgi:hypothetical protein
VIGWLDASVGEIETGVRLVVGSTVSGTVGLTTSLPLWEGMQETVRNTRMNKRIRVFMLISD